MAEITAALVKDLREKTGAGMMDCKSALKETNGDVEAAVDWLRKKGLAKAAKKAGRLAAEGLIGVAIGQNKGAMVEVNAETDFVARNDHFQGLVKLIADVALSVGDNVAIHTGVYIDATGGVSIGDNTSIAHYASILSFEHTWDDPTTPMKYNRLRFAPIEIGSDVLVFAGARVLAGARIRSRTLIGAGAIARSGVYTSGLYAGVPAKLIKAF